MLNPDRLPAKRLTDDQQATLKLDDIWEVNGRPLAYDRLYQPMTLRDFDKTVASFPYSRVAEHWIAGFRVSTVWLGCDYSFGHWPPILYETMIFAPVGVAPDVEEMLDHYMWRYSWEPDAREGHQRAIDMLWLLLPLGMVAALPRGETR